MFNLFDFNHDGKVSSAEFAMGMAIIEDIEEDENNDTDSDDGFTQSDSDEDV